MTKSNLEENGYFLPNNLLINSVNAKLYFLKRNYLKTLIKTIHSSISYNSQSYFLSIFLMDIIFLKENLSNEYYSFFPSKIPSKDLKLNDYILLSLSCLIISYKFNGNSSILYPLNNIIKIIYYISGEKFSFTSRDLVRGEAFIIKLLKYKLNFYTVYHYLVFFFAHGIIFKKYLTKYKSIEKNIFEKIYSEARQLLDYIIDQNKFFELYNGKQNYILACQIIQWATEKVLNIKIKNNENIFKVIYNINITDSQQKKFMEIIDEKFKPKTLTKHKTNITKNYPNLNSSNIYNSPKMQMPNDMSVIVNSNISSDSLLGFKKTRNVIKIKNCETINNKIKELNIVNEMKINTNKNNNKEEKNKTTNENIKQKKSEPLDNTKSIKRGKRQDLDILQIQKDNHKSIDNSLSLIPTGENTSFFTYENQFDFRSPSNTSGIFLLSEELNPKENINKPKIFEKKSYIREKSKAISNSSFIYYRNTYNTTDSINNKKNINKNMENSKVHKAKGNEPRDSCSKNRRITTKFVKREMNKKINNGVNKPSTIIINNNMQINTFINNDKNNYVMNNKNDLLNLKSCESIDIQPQIINIVVNGK